MSNVNRYVIFWDGPVGVHNSILYVDPETEPAARSAALDEFLGDVRALLPAGVDIGFNPEVQIIDTETGALSGFTTAGITGRTGSATGTKYVTQQSMGLIRLRTGGIVNGKRVQGRIFVPYASDEFATDNGEVTPAGQQILTDAGSALENIAVVWSRPVVDPVSGAVVRQGSKHPVSSAGSWVEWASQRRRRS